MPTSLRRLPGISVIHGLAASSLFCAAICFARDRGRGQIGQRMPDERRIHSAIAIELLFEGKNHQRFVDILAQQFDASLPPCPELRTDVIDDRNSALAHLPRHAPVEAGSIDDHGKIGPALVRRANQFLIKSENLRQMADDSVMPTTARSLASTTMSHPAARMRSPPAPKKVRDGPRAAALRSAARRTFRRGLSGRDEDPHGAIVATGL